jgi:hypothetical protein
MAAQCKPFISSAGETGRALPSAATILMVGIFLFGITAPVAAYFRPMIVGAPSPDHDADVSASHPADDHASLQARLSSRVQADSAAGCPIYASARTSAGYQALARPLPQPAYRPPSLTAQRVARPVMLQLR